ncbi:ABC transporter substrate-binding protein [Acidithiobacillus sp. M4-SHS-6]|uniref:ABC transporter substrate-binding protein n=1 Tax=Acidithiobacillus sp. M4-SHS-6 TaxID=3383024 RepID=UPI0039BE181E
MKKKLLMALGSAIGAGVLFANIPNAYAWTLQQAAAPYKGETITIVGLDRPSYQAAQKLTPIFEKETGIHVHWVIYPYGETLKAEMLNFISHSQEYDVVLSDCVWPVTFAKGGWVVPVQHFLDNPKLRDPAYDLKGFFPIWLSAFTVHGTLEGIPFDSYSGLLYYNKSMFKKAGIQHPPATWQELREDAQKLTNKKEGVYGYALQSARGETQTADAFARFLWPWGGRFLNIKTHKILVNDPQSVKGIEFRDSMLKYMPPGIVADNHPQVVEFLAQKRVAMITEWSAFDVTLKKALGSDLGVAPEPRGPKGAFSAFGGFAYMISDQVPQKEQNAAWLFVQWLTSAKMANPLTNLGAVTARKATDANPALDTKFPDLKVMAYTWEHQSVPNWRPQLACYPRFSTIVSYWGSTIELGRVPVQEGLNKMADKLSTYMKATKCWATANDPDKYVPIYKKWEASSETKLP